MPPIMASRSAVFELSPPLPRSHPNYKEDAIELYVFNKLRDYLATCNTDTQEIVKALIARVVDPKSVAFKGDIASYFWSLWYVFMSIAEDIPHDHPAQQRLVDILGGIARSPAPKATRDVLKYHKDWPKWSSFHLPEFNIYLRDMWCLEGEDGRERWKSYNALIAKMLTSAVHDWEHLSTELLREALEEQLKQPADYDDHVPAAAVYILYAGKLIYHYSGLGGGEPYGPSPRGDRNVKQLYHGPGGYNDARWAFWKKRFGQVATMKSVLPATREIAKQAHDVMVNIEKSEGEPSGNPDHFYPPA